MKSRRAPPCQRKRSWERSASTNDWPLGHPGVVSSKLISCPTRQHPHRRRTPLPEPGQQDPGDLGRGHSWKHPKGEPRVAEDSWSTLRVPLTRARSGRYPASEGGVPAQPFSCGQRGEASRIIGARVRSRRLHTDLGRRRLDRLTANMGPCRAPSRGIPGILDILHRFELTIHLDAYTNR